MAPLSEEKTPIQKFYSGSNVFITGATGFLGKALVEKLARSCPDIGTLYLLVRPKKGKGLQQRLDDLFDDVVFERLKSERPKFRNKIVGIAGDCGLTRLGIGDNDRRLLCSEVSVVFHVAAVVNFETKLKQAIEVNVRGTSELLKMCSEMRELKSVVHVSTAYSNWFQEVIDEIYYPVPIDGPTAILAAENFSDEILDAVTPKLIERYHNTYALTKAVGEHVVKEVAETLPVGIFRPSIVISSYKEPVPGWIDSMFGPTGITSGAIAGVIRVMHCDPAVIANLIPVDMCVNGLIAVAWEVERLHKKSKREGTAHDAPIYHYESSIDRPLNWERYQEYVVRLGLPPYPPLNAIWYFSYFMTKSRVAFLFWTLLLHYIPGLLMDGALLCQGKKPRLLKTYKKINKFVDVVAYFNTRDFSFRSTRMKSLISTMSAQDQAVFFCDLRRLDWKDYFKTYIMGLRVYLMKDPLSTLDAARKKWKRLYWLHQGCKLLLCSVAIGILWLIGTAVLYQSSWL